MKTIKPTLLIIAVLLFSGLLAGPGMAQELSQSIIKAGSQASVKGPDSYFTGSVRIDLLYAADKQINASAAYVTFEPGARSYWHTHPLGQRLLVVSGAGLTGVWNGKLEEIKAGDVVVCPAGVKHWHGAAPTTAMTHIAITGTTADGKNVEWMEQVSDAQYNAR